VRFVLKRREVLKESECHVRIEETTTTTTTTTKKQKNNKRKSKNLQFVKQERSDKASDPHPTALQQPRLTKLFQDQKSLFDLGEASRGVFRTANTKELGDTDNEQRHRVVLCSRLSERTHGLVPALLNTIDTTKITNTERKLQGGFRGLARSKSSAIRSGGRGTHHQD